MDLTKLHSEQINNAQEWAKMLVAPQDEMCRAPSSTPFLASRTRFVRAIDIPYAETQTGAFAVTMVPNALKALAVTTPNASVPAARANIILASVGSAIPNDDSYFSQAMVEIDSGVTLENIGSTAFQDLGSLNPAQLGIPGLIIDIGAVTATIAAFSTNGVAKKGYLRIGNCTAVGAIAWLTTQSLAAGVDYTTGVHIAGLTGYVFQFVNSAGTPIDNTDAHITLTFSTSSARCPIGNGVNSFDISKSEVITAGKVGNQRCVAMSLLVSNMAPALTAGGELVIARAPINVLASGVPATIMTTVKQLPEERYWRSGNIKDGGYAWWLPDDLASYEPTPIHGQIGDENILIAAGQMSDATGFVRIIATWVFEFYTPVQLFFRDYNCTYSQAHRDVWEKLVQASAVSANMGHVALIASAFALANRAYGFYIAHQKAIDTMAAKGLEVVQGFVRTKGSAANNNNKNKNKQNAAQPQSNKPKPKQRAQPPPVPKRPARFTRVPA